MDLPELSEAAASADKAAIYAEMRHLGGVPMVALIFRHLATLPGALEWLWDAVSPAWRSGMLQETAWRIAREEPLVHIAPMSRPALAALGVDGAALREIRTVVESYDRANPENLLTVMCALRLAGGRDRKHEIASRDWVPPPAPGPLVPMGNLRALPAQTDAVLSLVAEPAPPGGERVVQSLYRHFLHRPAFLALAVTLLRQRMDDGSVDETSIRIQQAMAKAADEIVKGLRAPPVPHPGVVPVCTRFAGGIIPRMIVVGRLLRGGLPE
jgi:hypothetical protein